MTEQNELYALRTNVPLVPTVDSGPYATVDPVGIDDANQQTNVERRLNKLLVYNDIS